MSNYPNNLNQNHLLTLLEELITNSYPNKSLAIVNYFLLEKDNYDEDNQERIKNIIDLYNSKANAQRQAGFLHSQAIKKNKYKKQYPTDFTIPSFKADYKGTGICNGCGNPISKEPGPAFFLFKDGVWTVWHVFESCWSRHEHADKMCRNKKYLEWKTIK